MTEFWEENFKDKQEMWGDTPADCVVEAVNLFQKHKLHHILIPGFGYGRNAKPFLKNGFQVTGIEISETAIELAKKYFEERLTIFHGNVNDMPFDQKSYDGIFCYALIHLLNEKDRKKLIFDCYHQLQPGGYMIFIAISTNDARYGKGKKLAKNHFKTKHGVRLFFYDKESIAQEFGNYGLIDAKEINEPVKNTNNKPSQKFWQITCKKNITPN